MKYWEIIADRLHAQGWSYGIAEHFTKHGLLFCVDAHRDGKRFIVKADDLLTAFLSLERDAIAPKSANGTATHGNRSCSAPKRGNVQRSADRYALDRAIFEAIKLSNLVLKVTLLFFSAFQYISLLRLPKRGR